MHLTSETVRQPESCALRTAAGAAQVLLQNHDCLSHRDCGLDLKCEPLFSCRCAHAAAHMALHKASMCGCFRQQKDVKRDPLIHVCRYN